MPRACSPLLAASRSSPRAQRRVRTRCECAGQRVSACVGRVVERGSGGGEGSAVRLRDPAPMMGTSRRRERGRSMKRASQVVVVLAFALVVALTGAGFAADHHGVAAEPGSASGASVAHLGSSGSAVDPALAQALRFAPSVGRSPTYEVDFTDWARIESSGSFRLSANPTTAQLEPFFSSVSDAGVEALEPTTRPFRSRRCAGRRRSPWARRHSMWLASSRGLRSATSPTGSNRAASGRAASRAS